MKNEPYWKNWREVSVAPIYAQEDTIAELDPKDRKAVFSCCGGPSVVLAYSPDHALEQARTKWPTAPAWVILGLIDPKDRECTIVGSLTAIQRLVTEIQECKDHVYNGTNVCVNCGRYSQSEGEDRYVCEEYQSPEESDSHCPQCCTDCGFNFMLHGWNQRDNA